MASLKEQLSKIAARPLCVDSDLPYKEAVLQCGKPILRRYHGWLCADHFYKQQQERPAAPRKPFVRYQGGLKPMTDEQVIQSIRTTDAVAIAEAYLADRVRTIQFGSLEPVFLKLLV